MNNELEQKRLLFAVARAKKSLEIEPENLIVKTRRNTSSNCKNGREEFTYLRSKATLDIDAQMMKEKTEINSKILAKSVKRVIAGRRTAESSLSV